MVTDLDYIEPGRELNQSLVMYMNDDELFDVKLTRMQMVKLLLLVLNAVKLAVEALPSVE